MAETISIELKSDLNNMYENAGELLNVLQAIDFKGESKEIQELMDQIMFKLEDICGTLQKDIYNCDYLITKIQARN